MAWNPGQHLFGDRYTIERQLGEGGIGLTYLAKNRRGELRVIKTLKPQILNRPAWRSQQEKLRQDFRNEALLLALCRHPHIVQVENVFDEDNLPCMAMEYIAGQDLADKIIEKGALSEAEALLYIRQIGDALTVVHEKGLLHRDLKPNNIMLRAGKQEAVLIDFGIARQFISGEVQQHTQHLTPGFAPPEQYLPKAERGEYIDVYALSATLYALLTGQTPISAFERQCNYNLKQPQYLNPKISDRVNEAIMKGMELNYKLRPQSVQEWLDVLLDTAPSIPENYDGEIIIFGPRPSGKSTYVKTLAYLPNLLKTDILQSIEQHDGHNLVEMAEHFLANGQNLPPMDRNYSYSLSITLNFNVNLIRKQQIKLAFSCELYPGELFNDGLVWFPLIRDEFLDDCSKTKYLALIINATSKADILTAQALSTLEGELNRRVSASEQSKYRIAVMFSHFDLPEVYPYRNNLNQFITLKFPETQMILQSWSLTWHCSVAYFAYSAFGMMENSYEPNFKYSYEDDYTKYGYLKNPAIWKPFGLVAPIYWLLTGKYDTRLTDI
ncbi:serine/threonine-protein kinase [Nostoc sp. FACHB-190]|uniref:serine/threonine protein kinase n=1 Tax=Nostoc sp. FACHB-190 TaxID=2692838 RepID=UPI001687DC56|nr:serine/threonine-protein kinase [Nostoc sp. FACHB-190]MBD2299954.1 serine/threonine protein kinase [Nostoc sp. FACHB-190]